MSENAGLPERLDRSLRWISQRSDDVLEGSLTVAEEGDRWFLGALRGLERGAARAQGGADAVASALAARWTRVRPRWARPRTPRERIESMLRAEGKRQGFDVKRPEFHEFSSKLALLLELVYSGTLPLESIAFEPAGDDSGTPGTSATESDVTREAPASVTDGAPTA
jgi:hypothetical protein